MPLDRLVLILVCVFAAAFVTVWVGAALLASLQVSPVVALVVLIPIALVGYILWRVIADRAGNSEDDHYDRIER